MSIEKATEMFLKAAERFGVPVVLLCVFLWMARETAIAVHTTVVAPVVTSHTKFIDTISEQSKQQTQAMQAQAEAFRELAEAHEEQITILREAFPAVAAERRKAQAVHQ
jgi:hypothetical protein